VTTPPPFPWTLDPMTEPWRLEFDDEGHLHARGTVGWREPICPECNEPIRWCLDMASFTTGRDHVMAHARCVWRKEAFSRERKLAHPDL
jgi:hypothetical protein